MLNGFLSKNDYFDVVVAFDKNRKTFRHQIFPQYKAHRKTLPPELLAQFDPVRQFLKISGITFFELDNYEADDILMSLAKLAVAQGY